MNTDKQRIYNGDWKTLHPYSGSVPTDLYYITLANKVLAAIRAVETSLEESDYRKIDETEQKELACILTAYFEDIISQTGIFQAFTRIHGKRFGKPLPFYTLDEDYTPGEINIEEVQFLVWHYHMQLNNLDIPYSPTLDTFAAIASDVMEIFETEYESAPENEKLLQYFRIDEKESHNLYALHARFLWLCTQSYLFFNNGFLLEDQAESLAEEAKEAGMDGVVASPQEAAAIREACGEGFLIVTPGIRPAGSDVNDQSRIATPSGALKSGSTHIVVGRPITKAEDKKAAAQSIAAEIRGV